MDRFPFSVALVAASFLTGGAAGQPVGKSPAGVYFHGWTGSSAGTEWLLCFSLGESGYKCADVLGNGFTFELGSEGRMNVLAHPPCQGGEGRFSGDVIELDWRCWGMSFSSRAERAPLTDAEFPIVFGGAGPGDPTLAGRWGAVIRKISPVTGATLSEDELTAELAVKKKLLTVSLPDGRWLRGVFESPRRIVFRTREGRIIDDRFQPFSGSASSFDDDINGLARVVDSRRIELVVLTQTRAPVGEQIQHQFFYRLTR